MPDTDIDTLKIKATADTKEAEDGLTRLKNSLSALKRAFALKDTSNNSIIDSISDAAKKLDEGANGKLKGLADGLSALKSAGKVTISKGLPGYITDLGVAVSSLSSVDMTKLTEMADGLAALKDVRFTNPQTPKSSKGNGTTGTEATASDAIKKAKDVIDTSEQEITESLDKTSAATDQFFASVEQGSGVASAAISALAMAFPELAVVVPIVQAAGGIYGKVIGKVVSTATKGISAIVKGVTKIELGITRIGSALLALPIKAITNTVGKLATKLQKGFAALTRVAVYRLIRSVLKEITQGFGEGIKNLYQYSALFGGTFSKSMDRLATSALYLKNSLGAMAAPLINALAPAIDFLVDKFVDLLNVINQVFAALTGATTWTEAIKYPYTYAEAANIATKANKELKKSILAIDEINKLTDNSDKGNGGSGSNLDYSSMFRERDIDSPIALFIAKLKEAFEKGDFKGVGELLGTGINAAVQQINDYISWDSVGDKISKGITDIATIFNTFGESVNWDAIGTMFSNGINTILNGVNLALNSFNLVDAAIHFADVLNGFVRDLDWATLGDTIHDYFMVSLGMIDAAITEFDWKALGTSIAEMFKNINTTEVLTTLVDTVFDLFDGAFLAFDAFVENGGLNTDFASIIDHVGDKLAERDWSSIGKKLAKAFKKLKLADTLKALTNLFFKVVSAGVQTIGGFLETADGKQQLSEAVRNLFENISRFLSNDLPVIKNILNTVFKTIGGAIVSLLGDKIKEKIEEKGAINLLIEAFKTVKDVGPFMINPVGTVLEKIIKTALQWLIDKLTGGEFAGTMTNVWNAIITALSGVVTAVTGSETLGNAVLKLLKPVEDKASTVGENAANNLTNNLTDNIDTNQKEKDLKDAMSNLTGSSLPSMSGKGAEFAQKLVGGVTGNIDTQANKTTLSEKIKGLLGSVDATSSGELIGKQLIEGVKTKLDKAKLTMKTQISGTVTGNNPILTFEMHAMAAGGYVPTGEAFIAREAGPELVGSIGNRTAVANNDQIVDSVAQGVYEANAEQNALLREQNNILRAILGKDEGGNEYTADAILSVLGQWNRRAGMAVSPAG